MAAGDTVVITVDAFPDDTAAGVVRLVPPAARQQDRVRVFDVEIVVTAGFAILRPGMTANVRIAGPTAQDASDTIPSFRRRAGSHVGGSPALSA